MFTVRYGLIPHIEQIAFRLLKVKPQSTSHNYGKIMQISGFGIWIQTTVATEQDYYSTACLPWESTVTCLTKALLSSAYLPRLLSQVQKVVVINTCSTARKFLNDGVYVPEEEADDHQACHFTIFLALYTYFDIPWYNPPSRYLVQSPYSGSLTTPDIAWDNPK